MTLGRARALTQRYNILGKDRTPFSMTLSVENSEKNNLPSFFYTQEQLDRKYLEEKAYYDGCIQDIGTFFKEEKFDVAPALLDYLLELKAEKRRKNGYMPDYAHEIDQIMPVFLAFKYGKLDRAAIEKVHGSIENWFCAILAHDIGEDFGVFPAELIKELRTRIYSKTNRHLTSYQEDIIQNTARSMEVLTHYRRFSPEEFEKLTGQKLDIPAHFKPGDKHPLDQYKDFFWKKMDVLGDSPEYLQCYLEWKEGKKEPVIVLTRHGWPEEINSSDKKRRYAAEWNGYMDLILHSTFANGKKDIYNTLVKLGDRIQGMTTRLAIQDFALESYREYLGATQHIFSTFSATASLHTLYPRTPLENFIESMDSMMGCAYAIGKVILTYAPEGDKFCLEKALNTKTSPFLVSKYLFGMKDFYDFVPQKNHPLVMMMKELRESVYLKDKKVHEELYTFIRKSLVELDSHLNHRIPAYDEHDQNDILHPEHVIQHG